LRKKDVTSLGGNPDFRDDLRRCDHCGKPGAEPWSLDDRTIYLHPGCQHAWADNQEHPAPTTSKNEHATDGITLPAEYKRKCRKHVAEAWEIIGEHDDDTTSAMIKAQLRKDFPPDQVDAAFDRVMELVTEQAH
jgi:hypothetical protein